MNTTIPVNGMSCGGCTSSVKKALEQLQGVNQAEASLQPAQVVVDHEAWVERTDLVQAIEDAGYEVPAS